MSEASHKYYEKICSFIRQIIYVSDRTNQKRGLIPEPKEDNETEGSKQQEEESPIRFQNQIRANLRENTPDQDDDNENLFKEIEQNENENEKEDEEGKEGEIENEFEEIEAHLQDPEELKVTRSKKKAKTLKHDRQIEKYAHEKIFEIWNLFTLSQK